MALKKLEEQANGFSCEYHKIALIEIVRGTEVRCIVDTYKNQAAKVAGKNPVQSREVRIPEAEMNYNNNLISQCYSKVKASLLSDAEDC